MASYTTHYGLHQWVPEDDFLRTDFNEDLEKIDTALGEICETADSKATIITGIYTGDGAEERTISLGFQPKALYICTEGGLAGTSSGSYMIYGGLAFPGHPIVDEGHVDNVAVEIVSSGFQLFMDTYRKTNVNGRTYHYFALH